MKNLKIAGVAIAGVLFLASCKDEGKAEVKAEVNVAETTAAVGAIAHANFEVEGMSCAIGCAKLIESKLAALDGVKGVKVDFETKKAEIEFDSSKQNVGSITQVVEKIANGAYKVEHFDLSENKG